MMRAQPRRDLYETADVGGKSSATFMVTYSDGESPVLSEKDVQDLWAKSLIRPKYPNRLDIKVFVLALTSGVNDAKT